MWLKIPFKLPVSTCFDDRWTKVLLMKQLFLLDILSTFCRFDKLRNITVLTICPGELIISSYTIITGTVVAVSGKQTGLQQLPCMDVQNIEGKTLFSFTDYVSRVITIGSDALSFVLVKKNWVWWTYCQKAANNCDEHIVGCPIKPHDLPNTLMWWNWSWMWRFFMDPLTTYFGFICSNIFYFHFC